MPDGCNEICLKLLLCSGGAEGVAKMSMKAAPKSGKIQSTGEQLVFLMEAVRDFEMKEAFTRAEKVAIIEQTDEIEEYGPTVMGWLESNHTPSHEEIDKIFDLYSEAIAALTPILEAKTAGWNQ